MSAFDDYVDQYGMHFNKRLYEWAVSMMRDKSGGKIQMMEKDKVTEWLKNFGITLKNDKGYDAAYVLAMGRADYFGSSISDEVHLARFVQDYLDDPDGQPTKAFDHFVVDCRAKGEPIFWDELM